MQMSADSLMLFQALAAGVFLIVLCVAVVRRTRRSQSTAKTSNNSSAFGVASLGQSISEAKSVGIESVSLTDTNSIHDSAHLTGVPVRQETTPLMQSDIKTAATNFEKLCSSLSAAGAETELASVLLAKGQALLAAGQNKDAARALRQAIEIAIENGKVDMHALARLELAEICRADGDLTTACEHWHLAKQLFNAQSRTVSSATTETRMRDHGCPTEWVLTEF
jgi:Flp pilus assembly protein TadD